MRTNEATDKSKTFGLLGLPEVSVGDSDLLENRVIWSNQKRGFFMRIALIADHVPPIRTSGAVHMSDLARELVLITSPNKFQARLKFPE